jgi:outer membrane protein OmpA-like peptidoglycan-associated protein
MRTKIITPLLLGLTINLFATDIPFEFYIQVDKKEVSFENSGLLKVFLKDREGLTSETLKGKYWNNIYKLEPTTRQDFLSEVKNLIKSREGTLLFHGEDYLFFKFYDKKMLYWGRIVYFKERYEVELLEEKSLVMSASLKNLILKNLKFDSNKATLQKGAEGEIERIFQFLVENSTYIVEIQGHTDSSGKAKLNLILSQKRADRVREALIQKGVSPDRIKAKGYGESLSIADNKFKEGRRRNRRVELKVLFQ